MNIFTCPICNKKFIKSIKNLERHLEEEHKEILQGRSGKHYLFDIKNKKEFYGSCIICKSKTEFNETLGRYERLCDNEKCKEAFREMFLSRMRRVHGRDTLLDDPSQQKKMLANRRISGTYKFLDGKEVQYVGQYELDFLEFLDHFLGLSSKEILSPAPIELRYKYKGREHFYIPDFFLPSIGNSGLLVEIKASDNNHYRARDYEQEVIKDKAAEKSKYNYIKILDKNYDEFLDKLYHDQFKK